MSKSKPPEFKGPGAQPAAQPVVVPVELPYQPDPHLPARREELPVGIDHPLYAVLIGIALFPFLLGLPFLDQWIGPKVGRRLGWRKWQIPGHNVITGTIWCLFVAWVLGFTFFALAGPSFCLPWYNGPICGA